MCSGGLAVGPGQTGFMQYQLIMHNNNAEMVLLMRATLQKCVTDQERSSAGRRDFGSEGRGRL